MFSSLIKFQSRYFGGGCSWAQDRPRWTLYDDGQSDRRAKALGAGIGLMLVTFIGIMAIPRYFAVDPHIFGSISAQVFDSGLVGWSFVMLLLTTAVMMMFYAGRSGAEWALSLIAGLGLIVLVVFPTEAKPHYDGKDTDHLRTVTDLPWIDVLTGDRVATLCASCDAADTSEEKFEAFIWFDGVQVLHLFGAGATFGSLILLAAVAFTSWSPNDGQTPLRCWLKLLRNAIYLGLAVFMVYALWRFYHEDFYYGEMAALSTFAIVWLIKGRFLVFLYIGTVILEKLEALLGQTPKAKAAPHLKQFQDEL